ncbi:MULTISPECIES: molecular chaperone [unclassified Acinetobacter]|uniref:fimbrial biogenesis chaperone n=1 Tax=unclassified Acinetobacter TaxID=196816 RepID=UPI002934DE2E|nr:MULTISPECIES: molecular chaperone [unclassified Acinetobacter]WOE33222.1 molecular chaperone [Acinetobacter sp. SAAs470]WOE36997.1 molecular chaperone [Acinetobacter sp. SAAs474]
MKNTARLFHVLQHACIGICAASIFMLQAHAASLQVAPILLEFLPQEKVKELWLTNTGDQSIQAQVRVNAWTQQNNQDTLTTSKNLIASPMVLSIPAGQRQLVRLMRNDKDKAEQSNEQAYRLIVDELPQAQTDTQSGLQLLLKYSIPVFFKTSNTNDVIQGFTSLKDMNFKYNTNTLTIDNQSGQYKRFSQFSYIDEQGKKIPIQRGLMGYVLSGQTMQWSIPKQIHVSPKGKFVAVINMDSNEQVLPLSP